MLVLLLLAAALAQAQPQTASLEGTVLNEVTGAPVPRAVVKLEATPAIKPQPTTFTDAEGRFRFDQLPAGAYSLTARKRGFLDVGDIPRQAPLRVRLESGQHRGTLVYKLTPQAVITGRVFDEFDEPVEGAYVNACVARSRQGKVIQACSATGSSNDRGEFRLTGLTPGRYLVAARFSPQSGTYPEPVGGRPEAYAPTYFPNSVDMPSAQLVEVAAGLDTAGIDIRLQKVPIARVSGRVVGPDGQAPSNFQLRVLPTEFSGESVRTGPGGAFEIRNLRPGPRILLAEAKPSGTGNVFITVNGEDVENFEIQLRAGISLNGTLALEGAAPGANWQGFEVTLAPAAGSAAPLETVAVRPDGSFTLNVRQPDRHILSSSAPARVGLYLASIRAAGSEHLGRELDLTSGPPGPVRILYRKDGGELRCTAERVEQNDRPPAVAVLLLPAATARRNAEARQVQWLQDDATEFTPLAPGDYLAVAVEGADYWSLEEGDLPQALLDAAVKVHIDPNGAHHLTLKPVKAPEL